MSSPLEIINALRRGVPPEYDIGLFSVGREDLSRRFESDLAQAKSGRSLIRYVDADFGQGKTHLLKSLREEAFNQDFVVSIVELSTSQCPLFSLTEVYRQIVMGLRTAASPRQPALETVLDRWLDLQRTATPADRAATVSRLPTMIQAALLAYLQATGGPAASLERQELVVRYLTGEKFSRAQRDQLELFENITDETTMAVLASITVFVRDLGYGGICILFDEAEGIVSFSRSSQRESALANLIRLIRMTDRAEGCCFVYAATPSFFDLYGDHPDLRLLEPRDAVLKLEPLSKDAIHELVDRICLLYGGAYGMEVPPAIPTTIKKALGPNYARVSDLTRSTVSALDEHRRRPN